MRKNWTKIIGVVFVMMVFISSNQNVASGITSEVVANIEDMEVIGIYSGTAKIETVNVSIYETLVVSSAIKKSMLLGQLKK